jgi:hypothetical protein
VCEDLERVAEAQARLRRAESARRRRERIKAGYKGVGERAALLWQARPA